MKILIVEPGKHPRPADIPRSLENMQKTVGGYIQAIYPWDDPVALVYDEEGLLKESEFNRYIAPDVAVFGTFLICGLGEEDFADLPDNLMEKYSKLLHEPGSALPDTDGPCIYVVVLIRDADIVQHLPHTQPTCFPVPQAIPPQLRMRFLKLLEARGFGIKVRTEKTKY